MSLFILPTFDLVTECLSYDPLFYFLKGGVKDVIKESVLARSFYDKTHVKSSIPGASGMVGYVLSEYDDYVARHEGLMSALSDRYVEDPLADYIETMAKIEFVLMDIEARVNEMLMAILRTRLYEVTSADWRSRDLYAMIHLLGEHR